MKKNAENVQSSTLLLGIDLGTSRSTIVSHHGKSFLCPSAVGWPRDMVAVKLFGKPALIGEEALENRESLNVCLPLSNGVIDEAEPKAVEATEILLEYLINEVKDKDYKHVYGIIGVPAQASTHSREVLFEIAEGLLDAVRIVSEPFSVAYNENKLNRAIIVDIGAGSVDICGTKGAMPTEEDQLTLTKGGDYVDNQLLNALEEKYPDVQLNIFLAKNIKEEFGFIGKPDGKLVWEFRSKGVPVNYDVSYEVQQSCSSIIPDIVEAIQHIVTTFDPEFQREALMNVVVAGGMSQIRNIDKALEKELVAKVDSAKVTLVSDPVNAGAKGAKKLLMDIPPKFYPDLDSIAL